MKFDINGTNKSKRTLPRVFYHLEIFPQLWIWISTFYKIVSFEVPMYVNAKWVTGQKKTIKANSNRNLSVIRLQLSPKTDISCISMLRCLYSSLVIIKYGEQFQPGCSIFIQKSFCEKYCNKSLNGRRMKFSVILNNGDTYIQSFQTRNAFQGGSKLVKSNLPRSKFPFIFFGGGAGRDQSWSSQICLDLNFPLFWVGGGSKLVKSNLPRSKFPFIFFWEGGSPDFYLHTSIHITDSISCALH